MTLPKEVTSYNYSYAVWTIVLNSMVYKYSKKYHFFITCGLICLLGISVIISGVFNIITGIQRQEENIASKNNAYKGVVVTNGPECAKIGSSMLKQGGSAVDAVIAAMICEGIVMPHSAGLGGGFIMTMYVQNSSEIRVMRTMDMFMNEPEPKCNPQDDAFCREDGSKSIISIPGELKGYWTLHQEYGKLPWESLIKPSIKLCNQGFRVSERLANVFRLSENFIVQEPTLAEIFINPDTLRTYQSGELLKRPILGSFLKEVAANGIDTLYNGSYAQKLFEDVTNFENIKPFNENRLQNFRVFWDKPIAANILENITLYTAPLPSSGPFLTFIFNVLKRVVREHEPKDTPLFWYKIVETFKYAFGQRIKLSTRIFDEEILESLVSESSYLVKRVLRNIKLNKTYSSPSIYGANYNAFDPDMGGSHICVMAPNGDAIAITSSLNYWYGIGKRSRSTGIILGKQLETKFINSKKIHTSQESGPKVLINSMVPSILLDDKGNIKMLISSGGGTKMLTSTAIVLLRYLWFKENLHEAIMIPRLHHQLFPMEIDVDNNFDKDVLQQLISMGHRLSFHLEEMDLTSISAIAVENGRIKGEFDCTKKGSSDFLN